MPIIEVEFEVWCATCGAGLCNATTVDQNYHVRVDACPDCLLNAREEGESSRDAEVEDLQARIEDLEEELV